MMGPGRPRKPTAALKRDGGFRPSRHGNRNEPKFGPPSLKPPKALDTLAKEEWRRLASVLQKQGLFTMADRAVFAVYCQAVSDWAKLTDKLNNMASLTYRAANGSEAISPLLGARQKAWQTLKESGSRFGLDPASRASLDVAPMKDGESDEDFLFGTPTLEK